jgi:hypothetical protein
MLIILFYPRNFGVADLLPQGITFDAAYVAAQGIVSLHQLHSLGKDDDARRKSQLHFENSACHLVTDEMACFRCRGVPHPPYSYDLAICDLYLFSCIKEWLMGITGIDANDLRTEALTFLRRISSVEN